MSFSYDCGDVQAAEQASRLLGPYASRIESPVTALGFLHNEADERVSAYDSIEFTVMCANPTMSSRNFYTSEDYSEQNPTWHREDSPWKAEQILRVMELPGNDRPLRICDIGCGVGGVIAALDGLLAERNIDALLAGYDIAPIAIDRARRIWRDRERLVFECVDALSRDRLDYDLCLLMDVLEHLEDPRGFLRALKARGIQDCIVHLPLENNWLAIMRGRTDPRRSRVGHLHFYDTHSALSMLERAGLQVTKWVYTPELDLDIRLHKTFRSIMAYLPRKALLSLWPAMSVHTIGGAALMARGSFK